MMLMLMRMWMLVNLIVDIARVAYSPGRCGCLTGASRRASRRLIVGGISPCSKPEPSQHSNKLVETESINRIVKPKEATVARVAIAWMCRRVPSRSPGGIFSTKRS